MDADLGFPPTSAAATLFNSSGLVDPTGMGIAGGGSDEAGGSGAGGSPDQAPPPLFFFQLPTSLPLKPGATLDGKSSGALSGPSTLPRSHAAAAAAAAVASSQSPRP